MIPEEDLKRYETLAEAARQVRCLCNPAEFPYLQHKLIMALADFLLHPYENFTEELFNADSQET